MLLLLSLLSTLGLAAPQLGTSPWGPNVSSTMLRFGCHQLVIDRIDPLVNPGSLPSPHLHQIVGGNAFDISMPHNTDISSLANCTTCSYSEDLSNYWTANLYFRARNGSYKRVPQIPNRLLFGDDFTTKTDGGFVVYYVSGGIGDVTAFRPGFRMLVGDAGRREPQGLRNQTCFRCYTGPDFGGDDKAPCVDDAVDFEGLPNKMCWGIRSNVLYPTCWDGKNLDSPDHKSHVAYPVETGPHTFTGLGTGGQCPESHPVRIPQLMLEIVWDTSLFNDPDEWPEDGSQPFVLSTGDTTGYGQHGDYVFGWKGDSLQRAMDGVCFGANCHVLESQSLGEAKRCSVSSRVGEEVDGWLDTLPGNPDIREKK
ncbi:hypothetical protein QC763_0061950 [Podospora pseudopauciseta]|uniref:DUF1996 domain-containing protein n=1 Tax=Podospora pseudopauciseta TaxID=2093780 RepID=A0ABR0HBZ9_9PEZI|nr:hypothetical protein QC763_0061950 [Podospora pseudopauciseta]